MRTKELHDLSCEVKRETEKAILVMNYETGEELWLPISQVEKITRYPDGTAVVSMTKWIATQKGLI